MFSITKECRCFWIFVKEYIASPLFLLSVVTFVVLCLNGDSIKIENQDYSVIEVMLNRELYTMCTSSALNCDFLVAYGFDASRWFVVILPVLSAFPILYVYDVFSMKLRRSILIRTSLLSYSAGWFLSSFIAGMLVALLGIMIYSVIVYCIFPPFSTVADEYMMEVFGRNNTLRLMMFIKKSSNCIVISGVFAVLSLLIYHLVRDKFLTITLPMMLLYLSEKGYILYTRWLYSDMDFESMMEKKTDYMGLLFPSNWTNQYYMWENETGISFLGFFVLLLAGILLLYCAYNMMLRYSVAKSA